MKTDIIIGSGLGGLECANFLAARGLRVLILERECQPAVACRALCATVSISTPVSITSVVLGRASRYRLRSMRPSRLSL